MARWRQAPCWQEFCKLTISSKKRGQSPRFFIFREFVTRLFTQKPGLGQGSLGKACGQCGQYGEHVAQQRSNCWIFSALHTRIRRKYTLHLRMFWPGACPLAGTGSPVKSCTGNDLGNCATAQGVCQRVTGKKWCQISIWHQKDVMRACLDALHHLVLCR